MKAQNYVLGIIMLLFANSALADAKEVLQSRLAKLDNFYAHFKQTTTSADNSVIADGEGEMRLKRPAYFNWQMTAPEKSTLVSDGKAVWMYTPQVQQVTVTNLQDIMDNSLLLLITNNSDTAWQAYQISRKQDTFSVKPKDYTNQHY